MELGARENALMRRICAELTQAALSMVFLGAINTAVFVALLVYTVDAPECVVAALFLGGLSGMICALWRVPRPTRIGDRYLQLPKELNPYEQRIDAEIRGRRRAWPVLLACMPYFAALAMWGQATGWCANRTFHPGLIAPAIIAFAAVGSAGGAGMFADVAIRLRRELRP
jgi:hypothetical protein